MSIPRPRPITTASRTATRIYVAPRSSAAFSSALLASETARITVTTVPPAIRATTTIARSSGSSSGRLAAATGSTHAVAPGLGAFESIGGSTTGLSPSGTSSLTSSTSLLGSSATTSRIARSLLPDVGLTRLPGGGTLAALSSSGGFIIPDSGSMVPTSLPFDLERGTPPSPRTGTTGSTGASTIVTSGPVVATSDVSSFGDTAGPGGTATVFESLAETRTGVALLEEEKPKILAIVALEIFGGYSRDSVIFVRKMVSSRGATPNKYTILRKDLFSSSSFIKVGEITTTIGVDTKYQQIARSLGIDISKAFSFSDKTVQNNRVYLYKVEVDFDFITGAQLATLSSAPFGLVASRV